MRNLSTATRAALAARRLMPRQFLWIVARDRVTGAPVSVGFWSDLATVTAPVIDPETGVVAGRTWYGAGGLISISDIPALATLTIQTVTIVMSQLHEEVERAIRLYDVKQARIEIFDGLLDPDTRQLVAPAEAIFAGFLDEVTINTPPEGEEGSAVLTCASWNSELTRPNPATRSHEDQRQRDPSDQFFIDAAVVGEWQHQWGEAETGPVEPPKKGLFGWGGFLGFL